MKNFQNALEFEMQVIQMKAIKFYSITNNLFELLLVLSDFESIFT